MATDKKTDTTETEFNGVKERLSYVRQIRPDEPPASDHELRQAEIAGRSAIARMLTKLVRVSPDLIKAQVDLARAQGEVESQVTHAVQRIMQGRM